MREPSGQSTPSTVPSEPPGRGAAPLPPAIPGFRLLRCIGQGGMARVYEATSELLGRQVAIKVIRPELLADPVEVERFLREARALAAIKHPRVIEVHSAGEAGDQLYLVLEHMPGGTVRDLVKDGAPLAPERALALVADAAEGLAALHAAGLVHRDVKPANLLLDREGRAVLGDLGMARHISGDDRVTLTGTQVGTPSYMAPEQMRGQHDIDGRADIYGLGATLYFLLTGHAPFAGSSVFDTVHRALSQPPPDLRTACPGISRGVVQLYQRMLARDRCERYQTVAELAEDLARVRSGCAPLAGGRMRMRCRPAKLAAAAVAAAAVVAALVLVSPGPAPDPVPDPLPGRLQAFLADGAPDVERIAAARVDLAALRRAGGAPELGRQVERRLAALVEQNDLLEELGLLDRLLVLPPDLAQRMELGLARLAELAPQRPELGRWRARLEQRRARIARLRSELSAVEATPPATAAHWDGLAHGLAELESLAGADAESRRWEAGLRRLRERVVELRLRLSLIDQLPAIPERLADELASALDDYQALGGGDPAEHARWRRQLDAARSLIAELRRRLRALDGGALPADLAATTRDLLDLQRLVGAADPEVQRWAARIASSDPATLRARLRLLDLDVALPEPAIATLGRDLARLDPADPDAARWGARLDRARAQVAGLRSALARLDDPAPLTAAELGSLGAAAARLRPLVDPADAQISAATARLGREALALAGLRARLAALDEPAARIDLAALEADLAAFARIAGDEDAERRRWRARLDQLAAERARPAPAAEWDPGAPPWASASGRDAHGRWAELAVGPVRLRLRACPPGRLRRGEPAQEVAVTRGWWLGETEVAQALWQEVTGRRPSYRIGAALPVENVSWDDCQAFLAALRGRCPGFPARLPSEAEWELACRRATSGLDPDAIAWHRGNADDRTHEVGSRSADAGGFHDLLGNVGEWCADGFAPLAPGEAVDPLVREGGARVVRGGSWMSQAAQCRSDLRQQGLANYGKPFVGLRLAADP